MSDIKWVINLRKRIFYSITGVTLVALCMFSFFISSIMYNRLFENEKSRIKSEFQQVKNAILSQQENINYNSILSGSRVTVIDSDGTVLYDTRRDHKTMDNHANRPEVLALENNKFAEATRLSDTLSLQTYYYAEKLNDSTVLRLSVTTDSIYSIIMQSVPFAIVIAACVVLLSAFISSYLTGKIIAPLYDIDEPVYNELDQFYSRIKGQERYIEKQKLKLSQKTEELSILTDNIADGLVLLNKTNEVLAINNKAKLIFGNKNSDFIRKSVLELNHSNEFITAIENVYAGNYCEITLNIHNKDYLLHISPVKTERNGITKVKGAVIIIIDNTERVQAEKMRKEFSANVSHELKTPLTSILGYAELIKMGMVKPEDIQGFSEKIYTEANSLLELIDDILKISRLDEATQEYESEDIDLTQLINNIISRLDIIADKKNIKIHTELDEITMKGIPSILDETFYNIIENAIKYNVENGEVFVNLSQSADGIKVCIKDTGIGIPQDSLDRVFERFYRVDKSHSSSIKGTGLGLSIVKHAVNLHNGKIDLESTLMQGTRFCVSFSK